MSAHSEPKRTSIGLACRRAQRRALRASVRPLGGRRQRRLERHLADCPRCRAFAESVSRTWQLVHNATPTPPPPPDLAACIWEAAHEPRPHAWALWLRPLAHATAVACFVVLGGVAVFMAGERLLSLPAAQAEERVLADTHSYSPSEMLSGLLILPGDSPQVRSGVCGCP